MITALEINQHDVSANEIRDISVMAIKLGAMGIYVSSPKRAREPKPCSNFALRPSFVVDLREGAPYGPGPKTPNYVKELQGVLDHARVKSSHRFAQCNPLPRILRISAHESDSTNFEQ